MDGIPTEVPDGTAVPQAARKAGRRIPTLCCLEHVQAIAHPRITQVYAEFLGAPLGGKSHQRLQTRYQRRTRV